VDRDAVVRVVRRRQASDALAFERDRAAMLAEQLEETVALLEGQRVDGEIYARLDAADADLVRVALRDAITDDPEDEFETDFDPRADAEEEIARLQEELEASARTQSALERYLAALTASGRGASVEPSR
jgi:hypothetical protein